MKNIKTYEQYRINEEIDFKKWFNKLRFMGLAALVTVVSCVPRHSSENESKPFSYRGKSVVTEIVKKDNIETPKTIIVETPKGEIKLQIYDYSNVDRNAFKVKRGDTLYLDIKKSSRDHDGIIVKSDSASAAIYTAEPLSPRDDSDW